MLQGVCKATECLSSVLVPVALHEYLTSDTESQLEFGHSLFSEILNGTVQHAVSRKQSNDQGVKLLFLNALPLLEDTTGPTPTSGSTTLKLIAQYPSHVRSQTLPECSKTSQTVGQVTALRYFPNIRILGEICESIGADFRVIVDVAHPLTVLEGQMQSSRNT